MRAHFLPVIGTSTMSTSWYAVVVTVTSFMVCHEPDAYSAAVAPCIATLSLDAASDVGWILTEALQYPPLILTAPEKMLFVAPDAGTGRYPPARTLPLHP